MAGNYEFQLQGEGYERQRTLKKYALQLKGKLARGSAVVVQTFAVITKLLHENAAPRPF
jgi:hypothetical protein